jgi:hypothetical protein
MVSLKVTGGSVLIEENTTSRERRVRVVHKHGRLCQPFRGTALSSRPIHHDAMKTQAADTYYTGVTGANIQGSESPSLSPTRRVTPALKAITTRSTCSQLESRLASTFGILTRRYEL